MSIRQDQEFMGFFWETAEDEFLYYYKEGISWDTFVQEKEEFLDHLDEHMKKRIPINYKLPIYRQSI